MKQASTRRLLLSSDKNVVFYEHDMIIQHHFQLVQNVHPTMPSLTTEFSLLPGKILVKYRNYVNAEAEKTWLPILPSDL